MDALEPTWTHHQFQHCLGWERILLSCPSAPGWVIRLITGHAHTLARLYPQQGNAAMAAAGHRHPHWNAPLDSCPVWLVAHLDPDSRRQVITAAEHRTGEGTWPQSSPPPAAP